MKTFIAIMLICFTSLSFSEQSEEQSVIVSPSTRAQALTKLELRAIFSMYQRHWPDGTPIKVFVLSEKSEEHRTFVRSLGLYPYQLKRTWDRMVFSGRATAPEELPDQDSMLRVIKSTPGAIGYISNSTKSAGEVNVLAIH